VLVADLEVEVAVFDVDDILEDDELEDFFELVELETEEEEVGVT